MKKTLFLIGLISLFSMTTIFAQIPVIQESNKQELSQTVGDAKVSIVYHRPNTKNRKNIFGCTSTDVIPKGGVTYPCLVPFGQVWRTGANDNTTIEFSHDVSINGQNLPAGKYGFFAIPEKNEWTLIFNKVNNEWGSYNYKVEQDALRVKVMPMKLKTPRETLMYEFQSISGFSTNVLLSWEKFAVPFTVNVGDVNGRVLAKIREAIKARKADDVRALNQGAGFIFRNKLSANYNEALGWLEESIKVKETFGNLASKSRILAETGKTKDAIETAEKAVEMSKTATPAVNPAAVSALQEDIKKWKAQK
jgi:hypothetical protein